MPKPILTGLFLALAAISAAWAQRPPAGEHAVRPLDQVIAEARTAVPPAFPQARCAPDLVELTTLDPTLRLAIGYATRDNFLHAPVYAEARAFLQRPVAEALVRANRALRPAGYALRIHDAYRPWWVTKVFWEVTAPADRAYVADPAKGSVHNRGCAVDVDLVDLATGQPSSMPSDYDEMSQRSHADYSGGDAEARRHREVLRAAMEAEGFKVLKEEWWHFDHASSSDYPIMNLPFEAILDRSAEIAGAGQVLLVTTPGWDGARGSLQRFERRGGTFVPVGGPLSVWIGHSGLAWRSDDGAPPPPAPGPVKREGDGRSPAGLLTFGDMWGYAPAPPEGVRFAYRMSTECDRCVDDSEDVEYGRLVRTASPEAPVTWRSAEHLRLDTEHYRYMVVIHYNDLRPRKSAGSCIFLHVAPPPGGGTAGCTALAVDDLLALLRWMDPARNPLLLQVPEPALEAVRAAWHLPPELRPISR
ncbi:M15 family metallopeptidase [Geothrix oryzisoli]|uniref:M15 family metallopeptidase n=1 Tax=Geothrix oryzisoli TaxID=2922721 RepID=UPI001FAE2BF9|nr:M15 family metallopeptidase [Geothrix oryzisoli]